MNNNKKKTKQNLSKNRFTVNCFLQFFVSFSQIVKTFLNNCIVEYIYYRKSPMVLIIIRTNLFLENVRKNTKNK